MYEGTEKLKNQKHRSKIGGQALFEGVMMRGVTCEAMAVRRKDGSIFTESKSLPKSKWYQKAPFVRGVFNFVIQLKNGYKYMMKSMDVSGFHDEDEPEQSTVDNGQLTVNEAKEPSKIGDTLIGIVGTVGGVAFGVGLFLFVPTYAVTGLNMLLGSCGCCGEIGLLEPYRSVIEGAIRIILFVVYMWAMTLMKEIRTTYKYHGAEHKVIAAFEGGEDLTVDEHSKCPTECIEAVRKYPRFHPRCGTSFIFLVLTVSILLYSILSIPGMPMNVATIAGYFDISEWWANAIRISIQVSSTPFVVAVTYELIKLAGRYDRNIFMRALSAPGLLLQRLTVLEPTDEQIQVAVAAMVPVIPKDDKEKQEDKW